LFTSRFSSGLILLEYIKGFKRYSVCAWAGPSRVLTHFDKVGQIDLKLALDEKCWFAAFNVTCTPALAVGLLPITPAQLFLALFVINGTVARRS